MTYISQDLATKPRRTDEEILKRIEEVRAKRYAHLVPSVLKEEKEFTPAAITKRETIADLASKLREDEEKGIDFADLLKRVSDEHDGEDDDSTDADIDPEIAELLKNLHKK